TRPDMHAGRVVPEQERLVGLVRAVDEVERTGEQIVLDRPHSLARPRARVLDRLFADTAEARIFRRIINLRRLAVQHSTGLEERHRRMVARVIGLLGLVLGGASRRWAQDRPFFFSRHRMHALGTNPAPRGPRGSPESKPLSRSFTTGG